MRVEQGYAISKQEGTAHKTHIVVGWLLGHSFDLQENLESKLLASVLLENSASPLMRALETTDIGHAPSPMCGIEDSNREMTFVCGIEGTEPEQQRTLEALIEETLARVVKEGVSQEQLEAILHQLEFHQREIAGDRSPYGLQLIKSAISPMIHGGDPVERLDLEPVLAKMREKIHNPEYVPGLIRRKLLENPHRVTLTLRPDQKLDSIRQEATRGALARRKTALTEQEVQEMIDRAQALEKWQTRKNDNSLLPKVNLSDVPLQSPEPEGRYEGDASAWLYARETNGLVYEKIVVAVPNLSEDELILLPYYTALISGVGCGHLDYLQMQDRISAESGGIGVSFSAKGQIDNVHELSGYMIFAGKALARNRAALTRLLCDVFSDARFDEHERIRELVAKICARREQAVTGNGHGLAMGAACQGISPGAWLTFRLDGLEAIRGSKTLDKSLDDPAELAAFCDRLAWLTSTQVNFCSKAFPTVAVDHPDAAALTVLGGFLRNGYLHRAIREKGGAYGGGAGQDSVNGTFSFFPTGIPGSAKPLMTLINRSDGLRTKTTMLRAWKNLSSA